MKKLLSYLLVIALVLVQFMPLVSAAEVTSGTSANTKGSIKIENIPSKAPATKYDIYKILELESYDKAKGAYTYVVQGTAEGVTNSWYYFLSKGAGKAYVTLTPSNDGKYVVTGLTEENKIAFTEAALEFARDNKMTPTASKTTTAGATSISFTELELGYYLVDSSLGALIALNTTNNEITIQEKNGVPVVDKGVEEDTAEGTYGDKNTADIGQTVNFQTTITAQAGAEKYVLYDKMDEGLTLNKNSIVVKKNGVVLENGTHYTVSFTTTGYTFVIDFSDTLEYGLKNDDKLVVTYSAVVNEKAQVNGKGNVNETFLKYGDNNETTHDKTRTYTFSFDLVKKTSNGTELIELDGAEFKLYNSQTGGTAIKFVELKDEQGNVVGYRVATNDDEVTTTTIKVGSTVIKGLDEDVYYLEETKAPEGYNQLTSRVAVNVDATINNETFDSSVVVNNNDITNVVDYENDDVNVINTTGTLLPSTGGMGTVLFITVGSIMVLGFGVLLVTKLRISKMEI